MQEANEAILNVNDDEKELDIVNFKYSLHDVVTDELYDYFTKDSNT